MTDCKSNVTVLLSYLLLDVLGAEDVWRSESSKVCLLSLLSNKVLACVGKELGKVTTCDQKAEFTNG